MIGTFTRRRADWSMCKVGRCTSTVPEREIPPSSSIPDLGTVIFPGRKVQPEISKFSRVCSYDRAGLGFSEPSGKPRTSRVIAQELHALLQAANVSPPFLLVGHSMGGYDVRVYHNMYPQETLGLVLVEASPDQGDRFSQELKRLQARWHRESQAIAYATPFGISRLLGWCKEDPVVRAAECNWNSSRGRVAEVESFPESAREAAATGSLGVLPLVVLSRDPDMQPSDVSPDLATLNAAWDTMQEELAHLSSRTRRITAKNSGHYLQIDRPDIVTGAVQTLVEDLRREPSPSVH